MISKPEESGTDCLRITSRYYDSLRFESLWNAPALALSFFETLQGQGRRETLKTNREFIYSSSTITLVDSGIEYGEPDASFISLDVTV